VDSCEVDEGIKIYCLSVYTMISLNSQAFLDLNQAHQSEI